MRYLDTNVLVRVITGDNLELATKAIGEIQSSAQNELCILDAVLVELCFILEFQDYKMARKDIADALSTLISTPQIYISDDTISALQVYENYPKLDYATCLLAVLGGKNGVVKFDKDLQKVLSSK